MTHPRRTIIQIWTYTRKQNHSRPIIGKYRCDANHYWPYDIREGDYCQIGGDA